MEYLFSYTQFLRKCLINANFVQLTVSKQSNNNRMDEKLQQTMTLTVKRLDQYQQVCFQILYLSSLAHLTRDIL